MYRRICILVLTLLAAQSVCFARTVNPGMRAPDRVSPGGFSPDSLNTPTSERNQRLYDSIQSKPTAAQFRACFTGCSSSNPYSIRR